MPAPRPVPVTDHMAAMRYQHQALARRLAAEIEKRARQVTLEVAHGQSVTGLLRELAEYTHRLQGEQRAIDVIDEWAARMKRAA